MLFSKVCTDYRKKMEIVCGEVLKVFMLDKTMMIPLCHLDSDLFKFCDTNFFNEEIIESSWLMMMIMVLCACACVVVEVTEKEKNILFKMKINLTPKIIEKLKTLCNGYIWYTLSLSLIHI